MSQPYSPSKRAVLKLHLLLAIIFVAFLAACETIPAGRAGEPSATNSPDGNSPTIPANTPSLTPLPSPTPFPTLPLLGSPVPTPRPTWTPVAPATVPIPISTAPAVFPLDNLRMAYILNGNLYVQDGAGAPKQLSSSGKDQRPIFSDDGTKLVFGRGPAGDTPSVFSVNADGTDERPLITNDWLAALGAGTRMGEVVFIPGTHRILFNTYSCHGLGIMLTDCTVGLFLTDTDSGNTTTIRPPAMGGEFLGHGNFSVSPNGKLISLAHDGQIDILNAAGAVRHRRIMKYTPSTPLEFSPRVFWLADSSELIAALPADPKYTGPASSNAPTFAVWRYRFSDNSTTQISLEPPPAWINPECLDLMSISPDGKQAIYITYDDQVYRGSLLDGSTQRYLPHSDCGPAFWSPDSNYFVYGGRIASPTILGSTNAPPAPLPGFFWGWIDAKRYIYHAEAISVAQDSVRILVGEIDRGQLITYQSNVSIPKIDGWPLAFVWLGNK